VRSAEEEPRKKGREIRAHIAESAIETLTEHEEADVDVTGLADCVLWGALSIACTKNIINPGGGDQLAPSAMVAVVGTTNGRWVSRSDSAGRARVE
jgi:hypothetical protein